MNQLFIVIVVLVAFTYFGGSNVPNVLKNNKQVLLGVLIGLVLGSFFGVRVEGFECKTEFLEKNYAYPATRQELCDRLKTVGDEATAEATAEAAAAASPRYETITSNINAISRTILSLDGRIDALEKEKS